MRFFTIITILALLAAGCRKDVSEEPLLLSTDIIECGREGGKYSISVSGPQDWITDNTSDWISIDKRKGLAEIEIDANTGAEREAVISLYTSGSKASVTIIQECSDIFTINVTSHHSPYKGSDFEIEVVCYEPWAVENTNSWISTDISESCTPETVHVTIDQSFEQEDRTGLIHFICGSRVHSVILTQDPSPYIALEKSEIAIDGDGGVIETLYLSNTDVIITPEDNWIRHIDSGEEVKKAVFEVIRNLSDERTGHVRITSAADEEYFKILTIRQGAKIDHPNITFREGNYIRIQERAIFYLNPVLEDMTDTRLIWSSSSPQTASVEDDGRVTVHTGGRCTITARNAFHEVSASITLDIMLFAEEMTIMLGNQDMSLNPKAVRFPGEVMTVTVKMIPEDAYSDDAVCISSDPETASVTGMEIRCLKAGQATITVESLYQNMKRSFNLIVLED